MKHRFLLMAFAIVGLCCTACSNNADIKKENVSRIIKTLSADDMKGRHAFSPEIKNAANFITKEFQQIGLSPLPGQDDLLQNFSIYSITPEEAKVAINGDVISEQYYFGLLNEESFLWKNSDADILYISKDDNFRDAFRAYVSNDNQNLIAVHEEHEKWFHRYRTYFNRSNRSFEVDEEPSDVFVLTSSPIRSYNVSYQNNVKTIPLFNVAGMIEGKRSDEIVLITAHYDHIGVISPMDDDSVANGANDNASGVAGLIETARYYSSKSQPERTLYFVAFTAEETGGYGSQYFSKQVDPSTITAMINIEMIGKPAIEGPGSGWITGYNYSDLGKILQNSTADSNFVFYPDPYPKQNLFFRSDNTPFAMLGVPAHSISTTPIDMDQDYHRVTDEFKTLDISHTTNTIQAIARGIEAIVSGEQTPTRINPDSLR